MPDSSLAPASRATPAEIRNLFASRKIWQSWLDVEAALAETQAELGIIPARVAAEIRNKANFDHVDEAALAADIAITRAPIVSLVRALAATCDGDAGGYVHWGATTQNVMQTGRTMLMRRMHTAFMQRFGDVMGRLADLAEAGAEMPAVARTNARHALPITFGFKVAGWIEEWLRHHERFTQAEPRVFSALWGGAVGAMHAFGEQGPELNRRLARRLGLTALAVPSRAGMDYPIEYFMLLAMFSATCSKIARDLYMLMADEFGEVYEALGEDVVGSSTMPHKINSKVAVRVIALAAQLRSQMPMALEAMQPSHEGDAATNQMIATLIDQCCPLAYELITAFDELLGCIRLDAARMRANLESGGQFIASEHAMMVLAPIIGRTRAHDIVHHAVAEALHRDVKLSDVLLSDDAVRGAVSPEAILQALDPAAYTGLSAQMAHEMAAAARRKLA